MTETRRCGPIAYRQSTHDPERTVLLVHGFPLDSEMWSRQWSELGGRWALLAADLRGFGDSAPLDSADPLTMEQMADDLARLLDGLQIRRVTLCGLSMGGYVALAFWARHAERLRGLVLCDTRATADDSAGRAARAASAETALDEGVDGLCEAMKPKLFAASTIERSPELVEATVARMKRTPKASFAAAQRGMARRADMSARLGEIEVPCLVLCGAEDAITPAAEMRTLAEALPQGEYTEIADAGHMAPLEQPDPVNQALEDWLSRLDP